MVRVLSSQLTTGRTVGGTPFVRCLLPALVAIGLVSGWLLLTVRYSYQRNWTALFCTGERLPPPAALSHENIAIFRNSSGYDGQAYHYIAHDPFFEKALAKSIDAPRLRYRRALVSLVAWAASFGDDSRIDATLIGVVVAFTGLGVYWLARLALLLGLSPWTGLFFLLAPSVIVSIDRILTDGALAAFCVGFVLYWREKRWIALWIVCALAALTRETGAALAAAVALSLLTSLSSRFSVKPAPQSGTALDATAINAMENSGGDAAPSAGGLRPLSLAAVFTLAVLPALGWALFCARHTEPENFDWLGVYPFEGLIWRLITPSTYALGKWIAIAAQVFDFVGAIGIVFALHSIWKKASAQATDPPAIALYLYAVLTIFLRNHDAWGDVYAFGRTLSPMLVLLALDGLSRTPLRASLPALLMLPRIGLQLGRQIINVAQGLAGI